MTSAIRPYFRGTNGQMAEAPVGALVAEDLIPLDSGEHAYSPGFKGATITAAGDTLLYDNATAAGGSGQAFKIHSWYAVPVVRGTEEPPVIIFKVTDDTGTVIKSFSVAACDKRKLFQAPANGRVYLNLDIAGRVPAYVDIEE